MKRVLSLLLTLSILLSAGVCTRAADSYGDEPAVAAKAALLYECGSGETLYSKAGGTRMYPASTTKIMTALLLLEYGHLSDIFTVSASALAAVPAGSSLAGLKAGEKLMLSDLLTCLLVPSGNDAANAIAEIIGGSIVVEQVFGIPGLGRFLVASIGYRDYPVVQTIVVLLAFWVVLVGTIADLLNQTIDPRLRLGGKA